jgi:hypothetical protein
MVLDRGTDLCYDYLRHFGGVGLTASGGMNFPEGDSYVGSVHDDCLDDRNHVHENSENRFADGNLLLEQW